MRTIPLKRLVEPTRPITYGIVQAGPHVSGGIPYIRPVDMVGHSGVNLESLQATSLAIAASYRRSALLPGDLVVSIGPSFGKTMVVSEELRGANLTQGTARVALTHGVQTPYVRWVLQSRIALDFWETSVGGATFRSLNLGPLAETPIPLVSIGEQCAIADYLDRETAQIDALVAKQKRFIDLLLERRSAVRDRLLARGASGFARGTETADGSDSVELPAGWKVVPVRRLLVSGPSNGVSPELGRVGDLRSLSLGAVRDGRVLLTDEVTKYVDRSAVMGVSRLRLVPGDVLIVRGNGNLKLVGRAGLVGCEFDSEEYIYPDLLIRVRPASVILPEFLVAALEAPASRIQIENLARTTVGTFKITATDVQSILLPVPPVDEQRALVALLGEQTSRIDALITKAEEHIALAKERRAGLITAAVTGQIDVRTARKAS